MMSVKCPACGSELADKPLKRWKFRFYDVGRYECPHCKTKFNIYNSPKSKFVICGKKVCKRV
jgi:transposase